MGHLGRLPGEVMNLEGRTPWFRWMEMLPEETSQQRGVCARRYACVTVRGVGHAPEILAQALGELGHSDASALERWWCPPTPRSN